MDIIITESKLQTKEWRKSQKWYINGKHNECEIYQIKLIEQIINKKINKTGDRIFIEDLTIFSKKNIFKNDNGFEYTENFDGYVTNNNIKYYFNLKFVCENGGAQIRSLREVYYFIKYQMEHLLKYNDNIYFINILDGEFCHKISNKFDYLMNKKEYDKIKEYIFIGDMKKFQNYWKN
jgi:hypothetical protein